MSIAEIVRQRDIKQVLHFTTNGGLVGILDSGFLKSRTRLEADQRLEFIFSPNAAFRKDRAWLDYVNLSLTRINSQFFGVSKNRWHRDRDIWWCVLAFDPIILSHEGVHFTTTNNFYSGVRRAAGPEGLDAMFGPKIFQYRDRKGDHIVLRTAGMSPALPTCMQAEVLYPRQVSTDFLHQVYVATEEDADEVHGQLEALRHRQLGITVAPDVFAI
jgi:hypothetical protein